MADPRILLGDLGGGEFGLVTSLPGFDVLTADQDDAHEVSFASHWADLVKVSMVATGNISGTGQLIQTDVAYPSVPALYFPFVEARAMDISDRIFYDDYTVAIGGVSGGRNKVISAMNTSLVGDDEVRVSIYNDAGGSWNHDYFLVVFDKEFIDT